ncbi:MAG TPA: hypothetical protein VIH89_02845 [Candidatus Sulfotelmatobacter sp.]
MAENRKISKASSEQFSRTCAKPRLEERPACYITEFRNEILTGNQRETIALPSVKQSGRCALGHQQAGC